MRGGPPVWVQVPLADSDGAPGGEDTVGGTVRADLMCRPGNVSLSG
jgi:hypothetical protein